jgi:hypothetical protein
MEKVFVVKRVAEKLWASEAAIDGAVASTAMLMADYIQAGIELKVSAVATEAGATKIAAAAKALADARAAMVEAHNELNDLKLRIGVRTKMEGYKPVVIEPAQEEPEARRTA